MTTQSEGGKPLIKPAQSIDNPATREAILGADLNESAQHQHQLEILDLFGTVDYDETYDYKKNRQLDRIECEP